jgi:protein-S-isoprenylcysteine O-methyltransferase Ste14
MVLSIFSHFFIPLRKLLYYPVTYIGYLPLASGIIINLWTDRLFKVNDITVKPYLEPNVLIISGPFRVSRHPMYLGMALILLGVAVIHGTIIWFLYPAIFIILMVILFIPVEESNLKRLFEKDYLDYLKKVRKWA